MASAYAAMCDSEAAAGTIGTATGIANQIIYHPDRARAFTAIWEARTRMGDVSSARQAFERALAAAGDADDLNARIDELIVLGSTAARIAQSEDAARAFSAVRNLAARIEEPAPRASALVKAAAALAQAEESEQALRLFSEALQASASIVDSYRSAVALVEIASALADHGP